MLSGAQSLDRWKTNTKAYGESLEHKIASELYTQTQAHSQMGWLGSGDSFACASELGLGRGINTCVFTWSSQLLLVRVEFAHTLKEHAGFQVEHYIVGRIRTQEAARLAA